MRKTLILTIIALFASVAVVISDGEEIVEESQERRTLSDEIETLKSFKPSFNFGTQLKITPPSKHADILLLSLEYCNNDVAKLKDTFPIIYKTFNPIIGNLDKDEDVEVIINTSNLWSDATEFFVVDKRLGKDGMAIAKTYGKRFDDLYGMNISTRDVDGDKIDEIILSRNDSVVVGVDENRRVLRRKYTRTIVLKFADENIEIVSPLSTTYDEGAPTTDDR